MESEWRVVKEKRDPQRRRWKDRETRKKERERERDKGRRDREVFNEDCIAVATRLIGFHFVFLPSLFLSFFSPLVSDVVLMAPPGYKATGY